MFHERDIGINIPATVTRTFPLFRAGRKGKIEKASWAQELAVDGTKTVTLHNQTSNVDLTNALAINGLGALGGADFVMAPTNVDFKAGDLIVIVYTVTVAGVVAPGDCTASLGFRFGKTGEPGDAA